MTQQILDNTKKLERSTTLYVIGVFAIVLTAIYIFLINSTVMHAVSRNANHKSVTELTALTAELEEKYLSLDNDIDLKFASASGFGEVVSEKVYVSLKSGASSLTFNKEE